MLQMFFLMAGDFILIFCSPVKYNFIKAKYEMLSFVHQLPISDDLSITNLSKVCIIYITVNILRFSDWPISIHNCVYIFHPVLLDPDSEVSCTEECQTKKLLVCCRMFAFFKAIFKFCTAKKLFTFFKQRSFCLNFSRNFFIRII